MAGNTKFIGFERGNNVVLERWGGKEVVDLGSPQAVEALREACYKKLPKDPRPHRSSMVTFRFNEGDPRIEGSMNADDAKKLRAILEAIPPDSRGDTVKWWLDELETAIAAFEGYFDKFNEPGVDNGESSS